MGVSKKLEVYKCELCGNMVEVLQVGGGELVCCGKPMTLVEANTTEAATEKHIPVIEETAEGYVIKVGSVAHPMQDEHYIEWIALCADGVTHRKFLEPGEAPEAVFTVKASEISAHAYCNIHGLWKA